MDTRGCERDRHQWSHLKVWRLLISRLMAGTSSFIGWTFWLRSNSFCNEVQTASLSFLISSTFLSPGRSEIFIRYLRFSSNYWGETSQHCQDSATTDNQTRLMSYFTNNLGDGCIGRYSDTKFLSCLGFKWQSKEPPHIYPTPKKKKKIVKVRISTKGDRWNVG